MSLAWALGALIVGTATFVQSMAGFGVGLVALGFLPYLMAPATAIVLITLYSVVLTVVMLTLLRQHVFFAGVVGLLAGTLVGTPLGVWILASFPAPLLKRLIGSVLILAVVLEIRGLSLTWARRRGWGVGAGLLAGVLGGGIGAPAPPVVLYVANQGWSPHTIKANLQVFFAVNQSAILAGYWWAGLLTREVWHAAAVFALPGILGLLAGVAAFARIDAVLFRRLVFSILFVSGLALLFGA